MRCSSIKKNKYWNRIESKLTSNSVRLLIDLLHTDVVHLSFLERIGLDRSFNFLFGALIGIVSHLLAFEALNLTDVSFSRLISTTISTVVALMSTLVVLILVIVMTAVMLVVMTVVVVV